MLVDIVEKNIKSLFSFLEGNVIDFEYVKLPEKFNESSYIELYRSFVSPTDERIGKLPIIRLYIKNIDMAIFRTYLRSVDIKHVPKNVSKFILYGMEFFGYNDEDE
jgi:hypothetical protein